MGHPKQTEYNRRWKKENPESFKETRRRQFTWQQVSKQFRRIGIYDEYQEARGQRYY
jgi:hypothetical protein